MGGGWRWGETGIVKIEGMVRENPEGLCMIYLKYLVAGAFLIAGFRLGNTWVRALKFYQKNNWDFSQNFEEAEEAYLGSVVHHGKNKIKIDNRTQIIFGYPVYIGFCILGSFLILFVM
jgi:hypothetical protein